MIVDVTPPRHAGAKTKAHSLLLIAGQFGLLTLMAWTVGGVTAVVLTIFAAVTLLAGAGAAPEFVLRVHRASPLSERRAPHLWRISRALAREAGVPAPSLYYIPSPVMNAFAVGTRENAAIAITDGLARGMNAREVTGVIAHEVSHIRAGDLRVITLARIATQLTNVVASVGQMLLLIGLPLFLMGVVDIPWRLVLLLLIAPTLSALIQLALSREREYQADRGTAQLTGDPVGLASALVKLESGQVGILRRLLHPSYRVQQPALLRTHPETRDRIERLLPIRSTLAVGRRTRVPRGAYEAGRGFGSLVIGH